jgi:hypothetical protein
VIDAFPRVVELRFIIHSPVQTFMSICFSHLKPKNHESTQFFKSGKKLDSLHSQNHDMLLMDLFAMIILSFETRKMVGY